MSTTPDPVQELRAVHPTWRVWQRDGRWYAYGPGLEGHLVSASSADELDRKLTARGRR